MSKKSVQKAVQRRFDRLAGSILEKLHIKNAQVAVFLLGGREMAEIKRKYTRPVRSRARAKGASPEDRGAATSNGVDVLAFPEPARFPHPETKKRPLGEVYINGEIARRDPARARYLLIHGILHLLGYTHDKKSDTLSMQKQEARILKEISNS